MFSSEKCRKADGLGRERPRGVDSMNPGLLVDGRGASTNESGDDIRISSVWVARKSVQRTAESGY